MNTKTLLRIELLQLSLEFLQVRFGQLRKPGLDRARLWFSGWHRVPPHVFVVARLKVARAVLDRTESRGRKRCEGCELGVLADPGIHIGLEALQRNFGEPVGVFLRSINFQEIRWLGFGISVCCSCALQRTYCKIDHDWLHNGLKNNKHVLGRCM